MGLMFLADVNFLVAVHWQGHQHHNIATAFLGKIEKEGAAFGLCDLAILGLLRIATHPSILAPPSSLESAMGFVEELQTFPHSIRIVPGEGHWRIFTAWCRELKARGPFITDVYLAALAQEHGAVLVSFDKDFARFPGLRWRSPLKS